MNDWVKIKKGIYRRGTRLYISVERNGERLRERVPDVYDEETEEMRPRTEKGRLRKIVDFRKAWMSAKEKAGCPEKRVHDLRRTFALMMRRAGIHDDMIMKIGGWKTR